MEYCKGVGVRVHRNYYGRRRQWRLGTLVVIILLITVFLVSCMAGSNVLWIKGFLGIDSADLAAEDVVRTLDPTGMTAQRLSSTVLCVVGGSSKLFPFSSANDAAVLYRGAVLNAMLLESYSTYTGNRELIALAQEAYPRTSFATLIPKDALEARINSIFGSHSTGHESAGAFAYLDRVGMYTTAAVAQVSEVTLRVDHLFETENTYKMCFTLLTSDGVFDAYTAIFQKKSEGVYVWKMLWAGH